MPTYFAKDGTAITLPFGPVLDSTGAEYTGAVVGDVKISKNNGTPAALNGSATLTHKEVAIYELVLTTSDISAVGQATITLSKTTYIAPPVSLIVLPATVYDALITNATNTTGGLIAATAAINAASGYIGTASAGSTATALSDLDTKIGTPIDLGLGATVSAGIAELHNDTTIITNRIGAPLTSLSDAIDDVKTDTGNLVTRITATLFSGVTSLANWLGAIAGNWSLFTVLDYVRSKTI